MGRKLPKDYVEEKHEAVEDEFKGANHDIQRKAALAHSGPINHKKDVYMVKNKDFDIDKTIFKSVSGLMGFRRLKVKLTVGNKPLWNPKKVEEVEEEYKQFQDKLSSMVLKTPDWENYAGLIDFMQNDCDFACEHADGSFMDHLYFCRDFSKAHYSQQSPRILFLHSIMGVGTNMFPMGVDKISKLQSLLTEPEFKQVAVFPSILRLLNAKTLIDDLWKTFKEGNLDNIESLTVHRVIDNESVTLNREELIVALNVQLIHQIDFLPCTNWCSQAKDPLFQVFTETHDLLSTTKLVDSDLKFNMDQIKNISEKDEFGMPMTLAGLASSVTTKGFLRSQLKKTIQEYSKSINHSMKYELKLTSQKE